MNRRKGEPTKRNLVRLLGMIRQRAMIEQYTDQATSAVSTARETGRGKSVVILGTLDSISQEPLRRLHPPLFCFSRESQHPMIDPRVASGLRDLAPSVMIPRERMLAHFRQTFAGFGFVPIDTPHIERMEVLTGKGAGSDEVLRQIFEVTNKGGTPGELALRFDPAGTPWPGS